MKVANSSAETPSLPSPHPRDRIGWKTATVIAVLAVLVVSVGLYSVLDGSVGSPVPEDKTTNPVAVTQTSTYCTVSASGTGLYVTVETDSGLPVVGAPVSGSTVLEFAGGETCEQSVGSQYTNSTGTALIADNMGSYYVLSVQYQGKNYTVNAPISPMETTYVTLKVPSGSYSVSEVFEGGCSKTASGVSCPG